MKRRTAHPDAPLRHDNHKKAVSRRGFLAQGMISGAGVLAAPSLFGLFKSRDAYAQAIECGLAVGGGKIPFICVDLAGGASVAGSNVLVGGQGGQLDFLSTDGYEKMGLPSDLTPDRPGMVNTDLGLAFHSDSAFLMGITSKTSQTTRDNINGTVICARADNDTDNNPHNPMYGINKAGANGDLVALIGSRNSDSGGRSEAPLTMIDPTVRPTKVSSSRDAKGLVDTGKLIELLDPNDAAAVMTSIEQISAKKVEKMTEPELVKNLIQCGYIQTADLVSRFGDPNALDPELDVLIAGQADSIFTTDELDQSRFQKTAAVMKLVVDGFAGAGTIEQGGYDYHDSTRATGEVRDFLAGQMMGAALEYAARRGQQLMLYVFSDGSVSSDGVIDNSAEGRGKGIWKGDSSSTASVFMLVYDPNGRPALSRPGANQLGYFRDTGSVETAATPASNNVVALAETIVLNYMALHGETGMFNAALPEHTLGTDLDSMIAFQPIRTPVA